MEYFYYMFAKLSVGGGEGQVKGLPQMNGNDLLANGLNLTYVIAGVVAILMVIYAGIMYTTANGDASRVTKAKNLLMYAIVGLIVVLAAFVITGFVRGAMNK